MATGISQKLLSKLFNSAGGYQPHIEVLILKQ